MKVVDIAIYFLSDESFGEMTSVIPPIGIGMISGYLSGHGYNHRVVNVFRESWLSPEKMLSQKIWHDEERAKKYAEGNKDAEFEKAIQLIVGDSQLLDGTVFAFSLEIKPFNSFYSIQAIARYLKERCACATIVGGEVQKEWMYEFLKSDYIDFAVSSHILYSLSGHRPFLEFLRELEKDKPDFASVPSLVYKDNGEIKFNEPKNADIFFPPDFSRFDLDSYRLKIPAGFAESDNDSVLVLPYRFSAGCRHTCAYCVLSNSKEQQHLSVEEIIAQLTEIVRQTDCRNFIFLNPCVNITKKFTLELAHALETSGLDIKWSDCARFEGLDKETVEALARAGCVRLYFGFDTMTRNLKKYLSKKLDIPQIIEVMKLCRDNDIWVGLDIIPGFPYETSEEIETLCAFIKEHSDLIDSVCLISFMLLRHTDFYTNADKHRIRLLDRGVLETPIVPFDELEGRSWEEISRHTRWAYDRIHSESVDAMGYCNDSENLPLLFWLKEKYKNKSKMRSVYLELQTKFFQESRKRKFLETGEADARDCGCSTDKKSCGIQPSDKAAFIRVKSVSGECALKHQPNQTFLADGLRTPNGICVKAFSAISDAIIKVSETGEDAGGGPLSIETACPGENGCVVFEVRQTTDKNADKTTEDRQTGRQRPGMLIKNTIEKK